MGVLQRFERRLSGLVEGLFARAFRSEVQPVEIAAALQRELDNEAAILGPDRTLVPNHFIVELGSHDHARLIPYERPLISELVAMVREHAAEQRYSFVGPVSIDLVHVPTLETGVFRVRSEVVYAVPDGAERSPSASRARMPDDVPAPAPAAPPSSPAAPAAGTGASEQLTTRIPADVRAADYGRLVIREGAGAAREVQLRKPVIRLGRGPQADIRLADPAVSRNHAELRLDVDPPTISDLRSTNGTRLNGVPIETAPLADGDRITLGETLLVYHTPARSRSKQEV
ncbi:MAG: DUF3662 domain-containing protein [Acidothermus sp.]|nr:DUF3662 domain-containing protein [Acidothermus sp.]